MKVLNVAEIGANQKELEIFIDHETFEAECEKAYRKNVSKFAIPGFRKGKAPRKMIERMFGAGVFYEDAINAILPTAYPEAIKESGLDVVSNPDIDIKSIDETGIVITAKVFVKPEVTVTAYKGLTATRDAVEITDEAVDAEIESVRKRNARTIDVTDRAVEDGDNVIFDFDGYVDGVAFEGGKAEKHDLLIGSGSFIPGFEDQMIGKNIGENFDVVVTFPEDYHAEELAGKEAVFKCFIHEIKKSEMPDLDDEFVKDVSEFDTVDEYKASVKATLTEKAEKAEDAKVDEALIKKIVENLEGEIPEVMFETAAEECIRDYESRLRYQGMDLETFMKYTGQTMETLKTQFRPQAEQNVKTRLALEYIAKAENLTAAEEEIETEYQKIADAYGIEVDKVKASIDAAAIAEDVCVGKAVLLIRDYAEITVNEGASDVVEVEPEVVSAE
ncbi:MAG: trigger factor [Clostridia bacterium]|nr:trigger factor [Clostridia bacterium]